MHRANAADFLSLRAERSNPHPVAHCGGDCRVATLLATTGNPIALGAEPARLVALIDTG
jgi:hypothetical protein